MTSTPHSNHRVLTHWALSRHPFGAVETPWVALPAHVHTLSTLIDLTAQGALRVRLAGPAGSGKSSLIRQLRERVRTPYRRVVLASGWIDERGILERWARGLGLARTGAGSQRHAWQTLVDALRLCRAQQLSVLLLLDGPIEHDDPEVARLIERVAAIDTRPDAAIGLVHTCRIPDAGPLTPLTDPASDAGLSLRLPRLTRSEAAALLNAKLRASGASRSPFSDEAISRLHLLSEGLCGCLERLAWSALVQAAHQGLSLVETAVIDRVAPGQPVAMDRPAADQIATRL